MKRHSAHIILLLLLTALLCSAQEKPLITFVPDTAFVPSFTADGTAHRLSYAKDLTNGSFYAGLGSVFPAALVRVWGVECLVSVAGTVYTTLADGGVKYNVTNADFYADALFDIPLSDATVLRLGTGHTSHHLVDDAVLAPGAATTVNNFARDYVQCFALQQVPAMRGFAYGGLYYDHSYLENVRKDGQFLLQLGADGGNFLLFHTLAFYAAADVKLRSAVHYGSTQSYQLGIRSTGTSYRSARIAYTYRTGAEERGQFIGRSLTVQSIGLYFDL